MNKNHEGYHDPTACEAVRRVSREQKRQVSDDCHLYYKLADLRSFQAAIAVMKGYRYDK